MSQEDGALSDVKEEPTGFRSKYVHPSPEKKYTISENSIIYRKAIVFS